MSRAITRRSRRLSGTSAVDDPLRQPLDDRRLADAGVTDQNGVVLGAAREDLDHAADLLVASDHRVELAALGLGGQVAAEFLQRLHAVLGVGRGDAARALHLGHRLLQRLAVGEEVGESRARLGQGDAGCARPRCTRSPRFAISVSACCSVWTRRSRTAVPPPRPRRSASAAHRGPREPRAAIAPRSAPSFCRIGTARPPGCSSSATSRWAGVTSGFRRAAASSAGVGDGFLGLDRESVRLHQIPRLPHSCAPGSRPGAASARAQSHPRDPLLHRQHRLDPGQVEPFLGGHPLDPAQPLDVALGVKAGVLRRALRGDQPPRLIHPQRLRVHVGQLGGDRDHEDAALVRRGRLPLPPPSTRWSLIAAPPRASASARGSAPLNASASFSAASLCSLVSFSGTSISSR